MASMAKNSGNKGVDAEAQGFSSLQSEQVEKVRRALSDCIETAADLLSQLGELSLSDTDKRASYLNDQLTRSQRLFTHYLTEIDQPNGATRSLSDIAEFVSLQQENNALYQDDISYLRSRQDEVKTIQKGIERLLDTVATQQQTMRGLPSALRPASLEQQIQEQSLQAQLFSVGRLDLSAETQFGYEQREAERRALGALKIQLWSQEALLAQTQKALETMENIKPTWQDLQDQIQTLEALQIRLNECNASPENAAANKLRNDLALDLNALKAFATTLVQQPNTLAAIQEDLESQKQLNLEYERRIAEMESLEKQRTTPLSSDPVSALGLSGDQYCNESLENRPMFVGDRMGVIGGNTYYAAHLTPYSKELRPLIGVPTEEIPEDCRLLPTLAVAYKHNKLTCTPVSSNRRHGIDAGPGLNGEGGNGVKTDPENKTKQRKGPKL